jgi:hypothetical protein
MRTPQVPFSIRKGFPVDFCVVPDFKRVNPVAMVFSTGGRDNINGYSLVDQNVRILWAPARFLPFIFDGFAQRIGPVGLLACQRAEAKEG